MSHDGGWGQPPGGGGYGQPPGGYGAPPGSHGQQPGAFGPGPQGYPQPPGFAGPQQQGPADYKNAGIFMLISSITTLLASLGWIFGLIWICVGVAWILPLAGAIFELVIATQVMGAKPTPNAKTASVIGLICAILTFNVIGIVLEVMALVSLGKPEVNEYIMSGQQQRY